ncbi:hypothetical protein KHC17_16780 [Agrobacterium salinitolerans]|uniref:hypothetical protein n=1 Tax=Agrobacterium salinitolerans TaxID=1183413 RepID=UPI001C21EFBC|nr:hypothetical protein [Agrobacterium salinitolerans]QXC49519.1 hypothetical protein KHC17_16780 [Agrobacterium salinitolerans]
MTGAEIMAVVGFFVMLFGFFFGLWKYIDAKIGVAKAEASSAASAAGAMASLAREELARHKTHVAETYATKAGMQEQTTQLLRAIEGIGNRIESMNERLDRAFENQPRPRSRAS